MDHKFKELADARWQALSSLQLEQKSVYDLIQRASEVQQHTTQPELQHNLSLASIDTVPEGLVVSIDMDLEAGLDIPVSLDECHSPSRSKCSVKDLPPPSPLVLTSGLARRLMQELTS